jgi:hypothetical protein
MSSKSVIARIGAVGGWLTLAMILLFEVIIPQVVAGQRVTGTLDATAITAYYSHSVLQYFTLVIFLGMLAFVAFVVALYELLSVDESSRFFARLGIFFAMVETGLIITKSALAATLVSIAVSGGDVVPLFRFWDILYNSGTYAIEAGLIVSFALAMRHAPAFPRWMPTFSMIAGALQVINMTALFVGIPDTATIIGNLAFVVWFVGANIGLGRLGWRQPSTVPATQRS